MVAGDRDTLIPGAAARATADLMPNAAVEIVAGAGHAPFIARPQLVADLVHAFLQPRDKTGIANA